MFIEKAGCGVYISTKCAIPSLKSQFHSYACFASVTEQGKLNEMTFCPKKAESSPGFEKTQSEYSLQHARIDATNFPCD